jgi:hypothetical protein
LFTSVLLSCQHHLKAKLGMYFAQPSFCIFEWCELTLIKLGYALHFFWIDMTLYRVLHC